MPILNVGFKAHREMGINSLSKEEMVGVFQIEACCRCDSIERDVRWQRAESKTRKVCQETLIGIPSRRIC
jgi:hypothetical protein